MESKDGVEIRTADDKVDFSEFFNGFGGGGFELGVLAYVRLDR
jgi:hypothetical protein